MSWTIDGVEVPVETDIELTAETLSLSFEVAGSELATWEALGDRAGDLAVETGFGGAFRTIARGAQETVPVVPAGSETPPFASTDWYIAGFDAEELTPRRYQVSLELQRPANRRDEFDLDNIDVATLDIGFGVSFGAKFGRPGPPDNGFGRRFGEAFGVSPGALLGLELQGGSGVTLRVASDQLGPITRDGQPAGATVSLSLRVSDAQAAALADAAGYPGGVVERPVPDDDSVRVDESGGRQTIILDPQGDIEINSGEWLLVDWSIAWNSYSAERRWVAELTLAEPAD